MPLPWLFNQWACNPFGAEPQRDAAVDTGQLGAIRAPSLADVLVPAEPVKSPEDYSTEDWAQRLSEDWPTIPNVIADDQHVLKSDKQAVLDWLNRHRAADAQKTFPQCFDYAAYQLHVVGFQPSGPVALDRDTMMIVHEYPDAGAGARRSEVQVYPTVNAIGYLKTALASGTPVMIGVRLNEWSERPNERRSTPFIEPTNHFVVAVGMGTDEHGSYISFFDYYHRQRDSDRLYLQPTLYMEMSDRWLTMTEVRVSTLR